MQEATESAEAQGNGHDASVPGGFRRSTTEAAGSDAASENAEIFLAVSNLPNIDKRANVIDELPKDVFLADRKAFPVEQKAKPGGIELRRPKDWAMCHPDPERYRVLYCLKEKTSSKLHPITQALVNEYPVLQAACRPYIVRQAIELDNPWFLWPCPWPGGARMYPGNYQINSTP